MRRLRPGPARLQFRRRCAAKQSRGRPRQQAGLYRCARHADLWPARRPRGALRRRVARPRYQARGARADGDARHHRLADRVSRLLKAGIIAVPVNTLLTEDDYRFMLADSRAKCLVVSEALFPRFQETHQAEPGSRTRHRLGRQSARLSVVRGYHRRRRAGAITPRRPPATTWRSGSILRARPASRRARCTCTPA